MTDDDFRQIVARANLAPSVHNVQPARWRREGDEIALYCDGDLRLPAGDPAGQDAALSCGAALEATVLALGAAGQGAEVTETWAGYAPGLCPVARLRLTGAAKPDPLAAQLEQRFTFRGPFETRPSPLYGWSPETARLITSAAEKSRIAALNDAVSLTAMRNGPLRRELLDWMRLSERHPRYGIDGMSRDALQFAPYEARAARFALGPLWGLLDLVGLTSGLTAEAPATESAAVIAAFHRPEGESRIASGRAYLRLWLAATQLGFAGWPMAALTDDAEARAELHRSLAIPAGRALVQVIRFGMPTGSAPPRARRPLDEVIL